MTTFEIFKDEILPITLKHEGGYVNDPADRGGETYRGVSRRANPNWKGWELLQKHLPLKRGDIINDNELKKAVAEVYWEKYFKCNGLNEVTSFLVALQIFDFAVHGGFSKTKLQELLNSQFGASLTVDGVIGQKSVNAINACEPTILSAAILAWRKGHLARIIERDSTQARFERGWNSRLAYLGRVKENN